VRDNKNRRSSRINKSAAGIFGETTFKIARSLVFTDSGKIGKRRVRFSKQKNEPFFRRIAP
jgi:beta-lactamase class D